MKVRALTELGLPSGRFEVGDEFDVAEGQAKDMIRKGLVAVVAPPKKASPKKASPKKAKG